MSDTALFVGWGGTHPGRERFALRHMAEWTEMLERQKADGEIERFETVVLGPNSGELDGFTLVYGTPEKLAELSMRPDIVQLRRRAMLDHATFTVIPAVGGEAVGGELSLLEEALGEYEPQHAFV